MMSVVYCVGCFCLAVMKFMGDFPLKGQTEQDLVTTILKVLRNMHTHSCIFNTRYDA